MLSLRDKIHSTAYLSADCHAARKLQFASVDLGGVQDTDPAADNLTILDPNANQDLARLWRSKPAPGDAQAKRLCYFGLTAMPPVPAS